MTPPPQEREQGLGGPQLDQWPCTAATEGSSARERHRPLEHHCAARPTPASAPCITPPRAPPPHTHQHSPVACARMPCWAWEQGGEASPRPASTPASSPSRPHTLSLPPPPTFSTPQGVPSRRGVRRRLQLLWSPGSVWQERASHTSWQGHGQPVRGQGSAHLRPQSKFLQRGPRGNSPGVLGRGHSAPPPLPAEVVVVVGLVFAARQDQWDPASKTNRGAFAQAFGDFEEMRLALASLPRSQVYTLCVMSWRQLSHSPEAPG